MTSQNLMLASLLSTLVLATAASTPVATFKPTLFAPSNGALSSLGLRQHAMCVRKIRSDSFVVSNDCPITVLLKLKIFNGS